MFRRLQSPILMAPAMALMFNLEKFYSIVEGLESSEGASKSSPKFDYVFFLLQNQFSRYDVAL
jgi:hypothetical protein